MSSGCWECFSQLHQGALFNWLSVRFWPTNLWRIPHHYISESTAGGTSPAPPRNVENQTTLGDINYQPLAGDSRMSEASAVCHHMLLINNYRSYRLDEHVSRGGKSMIDLNLPLSLLASVWALRLVTMSSRWDRGNMVNTEMPGPDAAAAEAECAACGGEWLEAGGDFHWGCVFFLKFLVKWGVTLCHGDSKKHGHFVFSFQRKVIKHGYFVLPFSFFKWRFIILVSQWVSNQHVFF